MDNEPEKDGWGNIIKKTTEREESGLVTENKLTIKYRLLLGCLILIIFFMAKNYTDGSTTNKNSCVELISHLTSYDKTRLTVYKSTSSIVYVAYKLKNGTSKEQKFKCKGNEVQLYANGSRTWMDM